MAAAAPVIMFVAPGPIDEVTASVARRRVAFANAAAACTIDCSLRPWKNVRSLPNSSSAWPMPCTLPWPKMPNTAGIRRRRSQSRSLNCTWR